MVILCRTICVDTEIFMTELTNLNIADTKKLLIRKEISAVELAEAYLNRAESYTHLNAFTEVTRQKALEQASISDSHIQRKEIRMLEGIPVAVKDLFCTKDILTTASSKILHGFKPPYESTVTGHLFDDGAVMIGKTNMDEFAMGSSTTTSCYGNTINPWRSSGGEGDKDLVPGGSSGGSAAAVAAKLCLSALGTDTGGSIRQPASFCGIVGIKPTYGRCSRWGVIAFSSSLDQAGVLANTVEDAALVLQSICGYDAKDSTSMDVPVPNWSLLLEKNIKGLRIGIPKEYRIDGINNDILKLWEHGVVWLKSEGAEIIDITLPHTKYALPTYYIIAPAEASSNLARYDGVRYGHRTATKIQNVNEMYEYTRSEGFGQEVKRRIMIGTYVLSAGHYDAYYTKAQQLRRLIYNDFQNAFTKVDAILTPTAPSAAFAIGERMEDPLMMYLNDVFTVPASLAGLPAISVPAGLTSDTALPLGLHIIGKSYDEETVLAVGRVIERCADFKLGLGIR